jgi:hypothetical protein
VKPLKHFVIGEYRDKGLIEALVPRIGSSLRVCIFLPVRPDASAYLSNADSLLPALLEDMSAAEEIASNSFGSDTRSTVFDLWIKTDGTASFTCGFLDGMMEGELVNVERDQCGILSITGQAGL